MKHIILASLLLATSSMGQKVAGRYENANGAQGLSIKGNLAFVGDQGGGMVVVDFSGLPNIANPTRALTEVGKYTGEDTRAVLVEGDTCYITGSRGTLVKLDVTTPSAPALLGSSVDDPMYPNGVSLAKVPSSSVVYVCINTGIRVFDTSGNVPVLTDYIKMDVCNDIQVHQGTMHLHAVGTFNHSHAHVIFAINPTTFELTLLGDFGLPGIGTAVDTVDGKDVFIASEYFVDEVDASDPSLATWPLRSQFITGLTAGIVGIARIGTVLFTSSKDTLLTDVFNNPSFSPIDRLSVGGTAKQPLRLVGDYVFMCQDSYGLVVVDITDVPVADTPAPDTPAPDTPAPDTAVPTMAPDTPFPDTSAPETPAPDTPVPDTPFPDTVAPPTIPPDTSAPDTPFPDTTVPDTLVPPTDAPDTPAPETRVPPTSAPDTPAPRTPVPKTAAPHTDAPETVAPDTVAPDTRAPDTPAPDTLAPPTNPPNTPAPDTLAPPTSPPDTPAPDTAAPDTNAPPTFAPPTSAPDTNPPATSFPATQAPSTQAPDTPAPATLPPDTAQPTLAPTTLIPTAVPTTAPATANPTIAPATANPTIAPATATPTIAPATSAPATMPPLTPVPATAAPDAPTREGEINTVGSMAAAGSALAAGAGAGAATRLVVVSMGCHIDGKQKLPRALHPTQMEVWGSESLGIVVGNFAITLGFTALCYLLVQIASLGGAVIFPKLFEGLDTQGWMRFPSAPLFVFLLFYQGTTLGSINLIIHPPGVAGLVVGICSMAMCMMVPVGVFMAVRRGVPYHAVYMLEKGCTGAKRMLIGEGEWVNTKKSCFWVQRWTSMVRVYREEVAWYAVVEFAGSLAISAMQAAETEDYVGCGHKKLFTSAVFAIMLVCEALIWPHARQRDSAVDFVMLGLQAASLGLAGCGYYAGDLKHPTFTIASNLMLGAVFILLGKVVLDLISEVYILCDGRRTRLQENMDAQMRPCLMRVEDLMPEPYEEPTSILLSSSTNRSGLEAISRTESLSSYTRVMIEDSVDRRDSWLNRERV
eukprot:TRINITY_DN818_c2_g1_i1.p1 TRINITY_DN818_c2_g1~~TRINITY_DN818_c2_g1_i1.p1  ORF type:complete len:1036 (+),score=236.40 TRINITY_DN818_c2_g1_i1:81-3188(+)